MIAHGFVDRATKDVDLFTEVDVQEALRVVVALREALEGQRLITRDTDRPPLDHRFVTSSVEQCTEHPLESPSTMPLHRGARCPPGVPRSVRDGVCRQVFGGQ
jgi:hypothetical protein